MISMMLDLLIFLTTLRDQFSFESLDLNSNECFKKFPKFSKTPYLRLRWRIEKSKMDLRDIENSNSDFDGWSRQEDRSGLVSIEPVPLINVN